MIERTRIPWVYLLAASSYIMLSKITFKVENDIRRRKKKGKSPAPEDPRVKSSRPKWFCKGMKFIVFDYMAIDVGRRSFISSVLFLLLFIIFASMVLLNIGP